MLAPLIPSLLLEWICVQHEMKKPLFLIDEHDLVHIALFAACVRERVASLDRTFKEAKDSPLQEKALFIASVNAVS